MKTYTVRRYTFTTEELSGVNPYIEANGATKEGFEFKAIAFNEAKQQFELDSLSEPERAVRIVEIERFTRKMSS